MHSISFAMRLGLFIGVPALATVCGCSSASKTNAGDAAAATPTATPAEEAAWFAGAEAGCVQPSLTGDHYLTETNCRYPDCRETHPLPVQVSFNQGRLVSVNGNECHPILVANGVAVPPPTCADGSCDTWYSCCGGEFRVHAQSALYGILEWQLWLGSTQQGAPGCSIPKDTGPWGIPVPVEAGTCLWNTFNKCMGSANCVGGLYCNTTTGICGPAPTVTPPAGGTQNACDACISGCSGLGVSGCCTGSGCLCQDECMPTATSCSGGTVRCCGWDGFCMCLANCPYN